MGLMRSCCAGAAMLFTASAGAAVNVEFRPATQTVNVGDTVDVGLYVVSDSVSNQPVSAVDLVFGWDPLYLDLLGLDGTGAVSLLSSGFLAGDPYGLNETVPPADGDGFYQAFANLGSPVAATPSGALLTTFQFTALDLTPGTPVDVLASGGDPAGETRVFDGTVPNLEVTGTLSGAIVEIVPEPASLFFIILGGGLILRR